jgi:tousled-like kinase
VLYYEMLYGKKPYGDGVAQEQFKAQQMWDQPLDFDEKRESKVSAEAQMFIKRCLTHNVENRPSVTDLCSDPYVCGPKKTAKAAGAP